MELVVISRGGGGGGGVICYNWMKFRSKPFSLPNVIASSSWFGHKHSTVTVYKMKNKTSFEIRARLSECFSFTDI